MAACETCLILLFRVLLFLLFPLPALLSDSRSRSPPSSLSHTHFAVLLPLIVPGSIPTSLFVKGLFFRTHLDPFSYYTSPPSPYPSKWWSLVSSSPLLPPSASPCYLPQSLTSVIGGSLSPQPGAAGSRGAGQVNHTLRCKRTRCLQNA